jgi:uncharacterized iron-regulated membrane protein
MSWYLVFAAVGAWLADSGLRKSDSKPVVYLVTQVNKVWKGDAHRFIGIFGLVLVVVSISLHFAR